MIEVPETMFDVFALALPAGLAFGRNPPKSAWQSENGLTCGVLTRNDDDGSFGVLIMRRRVDDVWVVLRRDGGLTTKGEAMAVVESFVNANAAAEPMPPGVARRRFLGDLEDREPSAIFQVLARPTHHIALWLLNQLYLAMPNPDDNWTGDCQTINFHTRMWEAQLFAALREQGHTVKQDFPSPDFYISNRRGSEAWIEAVTANSADPYDHVNAERFVPPKDMRERLLGPMAVRFAKTLRNKTAKGYDRMPHVAGMPFVLAIADFQAAMSMFWSREALICYLYGIFVHAVEQDGKRVAVAEKVDTLLGPEKIPSGFFNDPANAGVSAVIFTNACSISKLNRVGISAGANPKGFRYIRMGEFADRTEGALNGIPFVLDITSAAYRKLWDPYPYEPWSAELEVFHNPNATHPLPDDLLPEATHHADIDGELRSRFFFGTSVLFSMTRIQPQDARVPTAEDLLGASSKAVPDGEIGEG
jgi:hypothetical protein